mgnify:CR=1 FL=1
MIFIAFAIALAVTAVALVLFVTLDIIDKFFRPDRADSRFTTPGDRLYAFYAWVTRRRQ